MVSESKLSNIMNIFFIRLEELHVSDNELKSLDCVLKLPRLRTLVAVRNMITSFEVNHIYLKHFK